MSPKKFLESCVSVGQIKQAIIFADKLERKSEDDVTLSEICDDACRLSDLPEEMNRLIYLALSFNKNAALEWANTGRI